MQTHKTHLSCGFTLAPNKGKLKHSGPNNECYPPKQTIDCNIYIVIVVPFATWNSIYKEYEHILTASKNIKFSKNCNGGY